MDQNKKENQGQDQQGQNPNRDQAEGSRENVRGGQQGQPGQQGGGISNLPADREQQEQRELPNRGETREENR